MAERRPRASNGRAKTSGTKPKGSTRAGKATKPAVKKSTSKASATKSAAKAVAKKADGKRATGKRSPGKTKASKRSAAKMSASEPAKLATVIAKQPTASERKTLPEPEKPPRWPYEVGPQVQNEKLTAAQTREMKANLEEERDRLIQEITQLAGQNFTEFSASQSNRFGNHMADFASDSQMLETLLVQSGMEADRLRQVNEAIERIRRRRYGVCERCGGHIGWDRIQAKPFARYCIVCRAAFEQSAMRRRA